MASNWKGIDLISFMLILLGKTPLGAHFAKLWKGLEKEFYFECPLKGGKGGDDGTRRNSKGPRTRQRH